MQIVIGGQTYKSARPKARVWRELMEFDENRENLDEMQYIDAHAEIIAKVFNRTEVTAEAIVDNVEIDDIIPLYIECQSYLIDLVHSKLEKLPNETAPAENEI